MRTRWRPPGPLPLRLPGKYDRYRILEWIGRGGAAEVYLARHEDRPGVGLALKFLTHPGWPTDLFLEEAKRSLDVQHQGVVRTWDYLDLREFGPDWPPCAIGMTFYDVSLGKVLADLKRSGQRVPSAWAVRWMRSLAETLLWLHEEGLREGGLIHRDVKPGNILFQLTPSIVSYLDDDPETLEGARPLWSDLGVVAPIGLPPRFLLGQDGYKAPELYGADGSARPGCPAAPAQDVYAFGRVLEQLAEVVEGRPAWLTEAAAACLKPSPQDRPTVARLIRLLSPDHEQQLTLIREAGYRPEDHPDFIGRGHVFEAFERYAQACDDRKPEPQGGTFLIVGPSGVGKSALLTRWPVPGGQRHGYYFRFRDGRTTAAAMPEALLDQLRQEFGKDDPDRFARAQGGGLEELLRDVAARQLRAGERLMVFVDALDECKDRMEAVTLLPKRLPRGVFFIVSSRPSEDHDRDHLALLRDAGRFDLRADDEKNLDDVGLFVRTKLGLAGDDPRARSLAEGAGGSFQLATLIVGSIQEGTTGLSDWLASVQTWAGKKPADRLFEFYQETWSRIGQGELAESLIELAGLLAAAETWLPEDLALDVLSWYEQNTLGRRGKWTFAHFPRVVAALRWFLDHREVSTRGHRGTAIQLRHQSVREFLVSPGGPARLSQAAMHRCLAEYYLRHARGGPKAWRRMDPYGRFFLVRHLLKAEDEGLFVQAVGLLTSPAYLEATLGDEPPETTP